MFRRIIFLAILLNYITIALADEGVQNGEGIEPVSANNTDDSVTAPTPKATSNDTNPPKQNATSSDTDAILSSLYISIVKPAPGSSIREPVFKEGKLVGLFNSCREHDENGNKIPVPVACFLEDRYNDRLSFELSFGSHKDAMEKVLKDYPPKLEVLGDSSNIANPSLSETTIDTAIARVSIAYHCKSDADGGLWLKLTLRFGEKGDKEIPILWKKKCAGGVNSKIEFGYTIEDHASGETDHHPFGSDADAPYTVVPSDKSTEVYAKLLIPGAQQEFLAPVVKSSSPDTVQVAVRGNHPKGGVLKGLELSIFQVSYECLKGKGEATVSVSVGIPPFQNLSASWKKECGGSFPKELSIGSTEDGIDIVDMGKPTPRYMVGIENIGTPHSEDHLHLPSNQSEWTIYLTYGAPELEEPVSKDASIQLGRAGVTVEHPDVMVALAPIVSKKGSLGWSNVENSEHVIRSGDKYRISFRFVCRQKGESRLLVTLPLVHYDMLEFGIAKECDHAEAIPRPSEQWVLTVGDVFWGIIISAVAGGAFLYFRRKKKLAQGFAPVSTREQ